VRSFDDEQTHSGQTVCSVCWYSRRAVAKVMQEHVITLNTTHTTLAAWAAFYYWQVPGGPLGISGQKPQPMHPPSTHTQVHTWGTNAPGTP
jgi:hypothetical protein